MIMAIKLKGVPVVFLGIKENIKNEGTAEEKKSYNVKIMDNESDIYDWWLPNQNHTLIKFLSELPPVTPLKVDMEVGAYQTKPNVKLTGAKV
jgi:hypothetical protein